MINDNRIHVFITFACRVSLVRVSVYVCVWVWANVKFKWVFVILRCFCVGFLIRISFVLGGGTWDGCAIVVCTTVINYYKRLHNTMNNTDYNFHYHPICIHITCTWYLEQFTHSMAIKMDESIIWVHLIFFVFFLGLFGFFFTHTLNVLGLLL